MSLKYRSEIDGLRAIAVAVVVLYHAKFGFTGGYVGVDVFFVISGFLITSLIRKDLAAGQFTLTGFWERRVRRILPALAMNVALVLAAGLYFLLPDDLEQLAESSAAVSLLISNFYFWADVDYFAGPAELKPLLHTWSLAVEEQFYLGFPLLLLICSRFRQTATVLLLSMIALGSFGLNVWGSHANPSATFFLLPTRIWELLLGALLVFLPRPKSSPTIRRLLSWIGLLGIVFASIWYDDTTRFPGVAGLLPCLGAAVIIYAESNQPTSVGKLLSKRPLVTIGRFSYSLYLWHWPILALMRYEISENLSQAHRMLAVGLSLIAGYVSWRFVETPFRQRSTDANAGRKRVLATALGTSMLLLGSSLFIMRADGLPSRFSDEVLRVAEGNELPQPAPVRQFEQMHGGEVVTLGALNRQGQPADFLLWGDSHALVISPLIDDLANEYTFIGHAAAKITATPLLGTWRPSSDRSSIEWNQAMLDLVKARQVKNVFLVSRWAVNIEGRPNGNMETLIVDDESTGTSSEESKSALRRGLKKTLAELSRAGATVWIMKQIPLQKENPVRVLSRAAALPAGRAPKGVSLDDHRIRQANANAVLDEFAGDNVHILDPADFCFDSSGHSLIGGQGKSYYMDIDHLSPYGAGVLLRKMFEPVFAEMKGSRSGAEPPSP